MYLISLKTFNTFSTFNYILVYSNEIISKNKKNGHGTVPWAILTQQKTLLIYVQYEVHGA